MLCNSLTYNMFLSLLKRVCCRHVRRGRRFLIFLCLVAPWIILLSDPTEFYSQSDVLATNHGSNISLFPANPASRLIRTLAPKRNLLTDPVHKDLVTSPVGSLISLWPSNGSSDRILEQMQFGERNKRLYEKPPDAGFNDLIVIGTSGLGINADNSGRRKFLLHECPVNACFVYQGNPPGGVKTDAFVSRSSFPTRYPGNRDQIFVYYGLESPLHSRGILSAKSAINWTATYRRDSTLVTPYEKFVPYDNVTSLKIPEHNFAENKTKLVAWFVSNCKDKNGRLAYAKELSKHISVDIYGTCGPLKCPRKNSQECFTMLKKQYKFYLSFENSNCKDYITEKLYWNAYNNDVIPIVMGAHPDDYRQVVPPHSHIHVDDFESPRHLADYLRILDGNDALYNEYFRWKGTGSYIDTKFWCRLCSTLHARRNEKYVHWYGDIGDWWYGPDTCIGPATGDLPWATWRNVTVSNAQSVH